MSLEKEIKMIGERFDINSRTFEVLKGLIESGDKSAEDLKVDFQGQYNKLDDLILLEMPDGISIISFHDLTTEHYTKGNFFKPEMIDNQGLYQTLSFFADFNNISYILALVTLENIYNHEHKEEKLERLFELDTCALIELKRLGLLSYQQGDFNWGGEDVAFNETIDITDDKLNNHYAIKFTENVFAVINENGDLVSSNNRLIALTERDVLKVVL